MPRSRGRDEHSGGLRAPVVVLAAALAASSAGALAEGNASTDRGRDIAAACASCHYGDAGAVIPALAGLDPATIEQRMREFRDGRRPSTIMRQIAHGYSDAQIAAAAAYLSTGKP
ncbi:MAG TPA: c-type cytochrome [Casimicrobiaceae bacterium]|nr:c-type cytochrome [Casimicrobiaceae bacterium]